MAAILKSKGFWVNAIVAILTYTGKLPASVQAYWPYVIAALNVALQALTNPTAPVVSK